MTLLNRIKDHYVNLDYCTFPFYYTSLSLVPRHLPYKCHLSPKDPHLEHSLVIKLEHF